MTVITRRIGQVRFADTAMIGAVQTATSTVVACPLGLRVPDAQRVFSHKLQGLRKVGRAYIATLSKGDEGAAAELGLLAQRHTLVAVRNGETAQAAKAWVEYHAAHHGADAVLIVNRDPPDDTTFSHDLNALEPSIRTLVVQFDMPLGLPDAPDARDPALAPGARNQPSPPADPWHAPLRQATILELLRHQFLSQAMGIAMLDIADLVLPSEEGPLFDIVSRNAGKVTFLQGVESYPWRLRQGQSAAHGDHIAQRRNERRRLVSWAMAPGDAPAETVFRFGRHPAGVPLRDGPPIVFSRALGVVFPGIPVNTLVQKSRLVENIELVEFSLENLKFSPIRLPTPNVIPPRPASNHVSVITTMKNEAPFVLDWIAHNRAIGIKTHLVYTNDCEDGTDRLLDLLADAGVERRDNPFKDMGKVPQHAAFRAAEDEPVITNADWLLTLDVDEYINVHIGAGRLADLFESQPETHVFSMPWRIFGNSDAHGFVDAPVTHQFTLAAPAFAPRPIQAWAFKTLYRNADLFRRMGVHRPRGVKREFIDTIQWVDGSGRVIPPTFWQRAWRMSKANWGYDLVSVNHYAVRSAESFLVKRERGRVNHTMREQGLAYWFRMNQNAEKETSIQRRTPRVAEETARLLTLPGVAEAHAEAVAWHRGRIARLLQNAEYAAVYDAITSERMEKLSRMATKFGINVYDAGPEVIPDEVVARDPSLPFFFTIDDRARP